jgi:SAM-dependent methyltransferase
VLFKVPVEKIVYSNEPENSIEYTKVLDKGYSKYAKAYDLAVKLLPIWKTWIKTVVPYIEGNRVLEASFGTVVNTMSFSGYPNGKQAMAEFHRVLKERGRLLIVDFDYPSNRNIFGYWLTKLMESAGDTIRDMSKMFQDFHFEFTEEEIGGFGSVHFYVARKLTSRSSSFRQQAGSTRRSSAAPLN